MGLEFFLYLILIGLAVRLLVREIRFLVRARGCTLYLRGTVDHLYESSRGKYGSRFTPIVVYEYNGERYREEAYHKYHYDVFSVGSTVDIFLDPGYPEHFILAREKRDVWKELAFAAAATAVIVWYVAS